MKKKKTLIAITAVLLVAVVGVTFAYFQSSVSFENLFTTGTYKVVTTETFESPSNWAPGEEIPKTITSTNEGTIPAAVRVSYTEQWLDEDNQDITSQVANGTAIINLDNTNEWTKEGNYYYYNYILEPEDTTSSFMKSVTLNPDLNGVTCTGDGNTKTCTSNNSILGGTYKLTITKETVQADRYQEVWNTSISITEKPSAITYLSRQVEGQITPGDVIGIGETEDFYVISSNAEKTVLLAKYNLLVGNIIEEGNIVGVMDSSNTPGYGLQSIESNSKYLCDNCRGSVAFSSTVYWMDSNRENLISPYNKNDTIYWDSNNWEFKYRSDDSRVYPYIYDSNSTIYTYINGNNGYIDKLKTMGAPNSITGRLLSYEEAYDAQNIEVNEVAIIFGDSDYWLGTSCNHEIAWDIDSGGFSISGCDGENGCGVRVVIEIPTNEIK